MQRVPGTSRLTSMGAVDPETSAHAATGQREAAREAAARARAACEQSRVTIDWSCEIMAESARLIDELGTSLSERASGPARPA